MAALQPHVQAMAVLRPLQSAPDSRVDGYIQPVQPHWLRSLVLTDLQPYVHILLASFVTNLMALGGIWVFGEHFRAAQWLGLAMLTAGMGLFFADQLAAAAQAPGYVLGSAFVIVVDPPQAKLARSEKECQRE